MHKVCQVIGDCSAVAAVIGTLAGWLPGIAALFTIVWMGINIYKEIRHWKEW